MKKKTIAVSFVKAADKVKIEDLNLVIFIGLTGVGKTTTFEELSTGNLKFRMLPDRRQLTDEVVIPEVLKLQNLEIQPVTDRVERFELTKIYREKISNAGSIFFGECSVEAAGDYCSGPNHVLPTMQSAKFRAGLSVYDFVKLQTFQEISRNGLKQLKNTIITLAGVEGLPGHANSAKIKFESELYY